MRRWYVKIQNKIIPRIKFLSKVLKWIYLFSRLHKTSMFKKLLPRLCLKTIFFISNLFKLTLQISNRFNWIRQFRNKTFTKILFKIIFTWVLLVRIAHKLFLPIISFTWALLVNKFAEALCTIINRQFKLFSVRLSKFIWILLLYHNLKWISQWWTQIWISNHSKNFLANHLK